MYGLKFLRLLSDMKLRIECLELGFDDDKCCPCLQIRRITMNDLARRLYRDNGNGRLSFGDSGSPLSLRSKIFDDSIFDRLAKTSIGYEEFFDRILNQVPSKTSNYPPSNLLKTEDGYLIEIAVAGFSKENVRVYQEEDKLIIEGESTPKPENVQAIHQGLGQRSFKHAYRLLDAAEVRGVRLENGILSIDISMNEPEPPDRKYFEIS